MSVGLKSVAAAIGVAVVLGGTIDVARAQPAPPLVTADDGEKVDRLGPRYQYNVEAEVPGAEERRSQPGRRVSTRPQAPVYYVEFPQIFTQADGTRCLRIRRVPYPNPTGAATAEDRQNLLWRSNAGEYPMCPRTAAPAARPAARAAEYWRVAGEDLLPRPAPRIAPGFMLAGKLAYLEAGTTLTVRYEHPTPIGTLVIEATSQVYVDWGDDSPLAGPYDRVGGPWPDGTITHSWTTADRYDIRVTQRWSGRWSLAGESGDLAGLETTGVLEDFEVRQLQAVRNL